MIKEVVKIKCPICGEQLINFKLPDMWIFSKYPYCKKCDKEWIVTAHFKDEIYLTIKELEA